MIGFYSYTVVLTYLSLLSSLFGITLVFNGNILNGIICLMISGVCDMFDGKVASTKKDRSEQEKSFGIQIDSLCDLICFGVYPAIICYQLSNKTVITCFILAFYILTGLIRLAYYNVLEIERSQTNIKSDKVYFGLPITSIALILPLVYYLNKNDIASIYMLTLLIIGIAFITPIKIKKPHLKGTILIAVFGILEFAVLLFKGV